MLPHVPQVEARAIKDPPGGLGQSGALAEVPVIRFEHLTEAQKRAYLIADNQLTLNSG
jgi:hypothetical protein